MFETPSAALEIDSFINEGLDLAFVGVNDLTQYTLAADRENQKTLRVYNPTNPAVLTLIYGVLESCKEKQVETTISFQSPMFAILGELIEKGLNSVSVFPDIMNSIAHSLCEAENQIP